MKRSLFLLPLCLAVLSGCESLSPDDSSNTSKSDSNSTSGSSSTSSGSTGNSGSTSGDATQEASLVGTWWLKIRDSGSASLYADTTQMVLNGDGSTTGKEHFIEWWNGAVTQNEVCSRTGRWSSSSGKCRFEYTTTCSITLDGTTTTQTHSGVDTSTCTINGTKLILVFDGGGENDTAIYTRD